MFNVYVNKMKVAGSDKLETALHYAYGYREEGEVTVKEGRKIICVMSEKKS